MVESEFDLGLSYVPAQQHGLTEEKISAIRDYPTRSCYSEAERVVLDFVEQWVIQSSAITDADTDRMQTVMTPEAFMYLCKAMSVIDQFARANSAFRIGRPDFSPVPTAQLHAGSLKGQSIMATTPRIPAHLVDGFFMQVEDDGSPAAAIAIPVELSRLAGIPVASRSSFQINPVLHELIRLYNAKYQDCQYCQNARQTIAVQSGLKEDMVGALSPLRGQPGHPGELQGGAADHRGYRDQPRRCSTMTCGPMRSRHFTETRAGRHRAAVDAHDGEQGDDHARPRPRQGGQLAAVLPDRRSSTGTRRS